MKTDAIIIQHDSSKKYFFGYVSGFPAICAQADSVDAVLASLKACAKLYFDYMAKNEIEISNKELISL